MSPHERDNWIEARRSIVIARPHDLVFAFVCEPRNDSDWLTNVGDVQWLTPGPFRTGSRFREFPIFLGARVQMEWEVTDFDPTGHFAGRSISAPVAFERSIDCEATGCGTRLTKFVRLQIALPFLSVSAADGLLKNATDRALARLKTVLERAELSPAISGDT